MTAAGITKSASIDGLVVDKALLTVIAVVACASGQEYLDYSIVESGGKGVRVMRTEDGLGN